MKTAPSADSPKQQPVYCRHCATQIGQYDRACAACGADQNLNTRNRYVATLLAILLGFLGFHRFYLGQWWGIFYALFSLTGVPLLISLVEAIYFFNTSDEEWNERYFNPPRVHMLLMAFAGLVIVFMLLLGSMVALVATSMQHRSKLDTEQHAPLELEQPR